MFSFRFKYYGAAFLVLGLLACQPTLPAPVPSGAQPLQQGAVSPPTLSPEVFAALKREYAGFKTQALSENYLRRKVLHFIATDQGEAMRREIEFARYRHPELLAGIMQAEPDVYTSASEQAEVQAFRSLSPDFDAYMLLLSGALSTYTNDLGMTFVNIPAGSFEMGQVDIANATPVHTVHLSAFQMQTTEVTQKQWWDIMESWPLGPNPTFPGDNSTTYGVGDNYPMYYVSWCDIAGSSDDPQNCSLVPLGQSFLDKLNATGTGTYRLPTEAEWEYAARAGTATPYACGEYVAGEDGCPGSMAWFSENNTYGGESSGSKEVARKQPNAWGLYDMHGNVRELVYDRYSSNYYSSFPKTDPLGPETGFNRVFRGGYWSGGANLITSAYRVGSNPTSPNYRHGFRVVRLP